MLSLASKRCGHASGQITFVESPAHPLDVASDSIDIAVCQQGFQFFPDRRSAAAELHRVLRDGGRAIASCWLGVDRCQLFGAICDALNGMGEAETADLMQRPFVQNGPELHDQFTAAGFVDVTLGEEELPLAVGSTDAAVDLAFATPIGPRLREMPESRREAFRSALAERVNALTEDGHIAGTMVSHVLTARKS
jgi:SAM-dependent methyltransferase